MSSSNRSTKASTKAFPTTSSSKFSSEASRPSEKLFRALGLWAIAAYRTLGTTHLGGSCRFQPSCSEYAVQALHEHRPFVAFRLIVHRLWHCRPMGPFGFDPVPPRGGSHVCS